MLFTGGWTPWSRDLFQWMNKVNRAMDGSLIADDAFNRMFGAYEYMREV